MNTIKRALLIMPLLFLVIGIISIGTTTILESIVIILSVIGILIIIYLATIGILGE